jgi:nitrite reductase/ring-hydroxylating ferredoxin subunit
VIFVWYGNDLAHPDRPFPTLFAEPYPTPYMTSPPSVFENTHVMDFVENGSDNLHFSAVHLWDHSRIYDHVVTPETIILKQDTRFHYGRCSLKRHIRLLSKVLPELELTQDYVYHGPGLAVVGATGKGSPDMHALVSLTPEGPNRTRVYVTIALAPTTFPAVAQRAFARVTRGRSLCGTAAGIMAGYIANEFDIDRIIWFHRRHSHTPRLLPSEAHLQEVIRWGQTFYPPDFEAVDDIGPAPAPPRWRELDDLDALSATEVRSYELDGHHLVAFLDHRGAPRVFPAHCPHQGAHLGHGGRIEDGCLRCPFHAFSFDPDGRCVGRNPRKRSSPIDLLAIDVIEHRVVKSRVEVFV